MIRTVLSSVALGILLIAPAAAQAVTQSPSSTQSEPAFVVNLNTATLTELQRLPGVGVRTAERIIEFREKNGPFKKIEEVMNVQGIGEKTFLRLRPQLSVGSDEAANANAQR
jgi:competence protein ComEA